MILTFNDSHAKKMAHYHFEGDLERLSLLHQGSSRAKDWTYVVDCSGYKRLFYNFDRGRTEYYSLRDGLPKRLLHYMTLPSGWTHILQEGITGEEALPLLFCYKSDTGDASFYVINVDDEIDLRISAPSDDGIALRANVTLLPGWTHVLPFDLKRILPPLTPHRNGLFFYNSENGLVKIYASDGEGHMRAVFRTTLSTGWTHIVPINTLADSIPLLLFYNNSSGDVAFYEVNRQRGMKQVCGDRWEKGWTQIVFGTFSIDQERGVNSALLFYNGASGVAQLSRVDDPASVSQVSRTILAPGWTQVIWLIDAP